MDAGSGSAAEEAEAHLLKLIKRWGGGKHVWAVSRRRRGERITHSFAPSGACFLLTFAGLRYQSDTFQRGPTFEDAASPL